MTSKENQSKKVSLSINLRRIEEERRRQAEAAEAARRRKQGEERRRQQEARGAAFAPSIAIDLRTFWRRAINAIDTIFSIPYSTVERMSLEILGIC